jgi:hypothetical protein
MLARVIFIEPPAQEARPRRPLNESWGELTRVAVQVSNTQNISGAALLAGVESVRAGVVRGRRVVCGRSESSGDEAEDSDQRVLHFDGWGWSRIDLEVAE